MNFKRYIEASDTWVDSHYIMGTDTDTLITLPAVVYPNAATATVGLKGQAVQSGTPTPQNPIMPQETGERTGNLSNVYEKSKTDQELFAQIELPEIIPAGVYTFSANVTPTLGTTSARISFRDANDNLVTNLRLYFSEGRSSGTLTLTGAAKKLFIYGSWSASDYVAISYTDIMLNAGDTAVPFEPYGYKIPISCGGTTTPVYLGQVQTTRKIYKQILTGNEDFVTTGSSSNAYVRTQIGRVNTYVPDVIVCSHCQYGDISTATTGYGCDIVNSAGQGYDYLAFRLENLQSSQAFISYLAQQYAAGTPVCVWYVLAKPTTGIINEPIRKIGDYADTVSGITIPTTAGANTIDVDTTVQPSEVTVNYKGWHPVQSVHERENGAWT